MLLENSRTKAMRTIQNIKRQHQAQSGAITKRGEETPLHAARGGGTGEGDQGLRGAQAQGDEGRHYVGGGCRRQEEESEQPRVFRQEQAEEAT